MTIDLFMENIKDSVRDAGVDGTVLQLKQPSGRNPRVKHVKQSEWFNNLSQEDQHMVARVMTEAVDEALFGLFAVLDSVRTIDDDFEESGHFELVYVNKGERVLLNNPDGLDLHDAYNAITNDE